MLNIVVPMAGLGSRFARAGYDVPKPLISVHGAPMIRLVINNIRPAGAHHFIFVCLAEHVETYDLENRLAAWAPGCTVLQLERPTAGAACTVLEATPLIDSDCPLMIANSDQFVDISIDRYLDQMELRRLDGLIMTMQADDPKWSFAAIDGQGLVTRVAEKEPISSHATVGIYNWRHGADFVRCARAMIVRGKRVNGEFYVAPVYNEMIAAGRRVGVHDIDSDGGRMHGLGIPADLDAFLRLPLSRRIAGALASEPRAGMAA